MKVEEIHMTKKDLRELFWMKQNIARLEEKLANLESEVTKTNELIKIRSGARPAEDKLGDLVSRMVDLQNEINEKLQKYYEHVKQIEQKIEALPPREALLIRLRYIEQMRWEEICVEMNYSWRQIHYIHAEALKKLA